MKNAVNNLPRNLEETYNRMLQSIPEDIKNGAIRLLQFLVHTHKPLTVPQAIEILATEEEPPYFDVEGRVFDKEEVLRHCPGLISIVSRKNELHLAHFSVKEYLLREDQFKISTASISITRTCLAYLTDIDISYGSTTSSYEGIADSRTRIRSKRQAIYKISRTYESFPMTQYAAKAWVRCAAQAQASEEIVRAIVRFLEEEMTFHKWFFISFPEGIHRACFAPQGTRLYYTCLVGLVEPARDLISKGADVNAQGGQYGNALQAASQGGFREIVLLLLANGADVNAQGGEYGNALQAASRFREIRLLLLANGADTNAGGSSFSNAR